MWKFYEPLWQNSEKARYLAFGGFTMNAEAVENFLRKKHHVAIERWAHAQLGIPQPTDALKPIQGKAADPLEGTTPVKPEVASTNAPSQPSSQSPPAGS